MQLQVGAGWKGQCLSVGADKGRVFAFLKHTLKTESPPSAQVWIDLHDHLTYITWDILKMTYIPETALKWLKLNISQQSAWAKVILYLMHFILNIVRSCFTI